MHLTRQAAEVWTEGTGVSFGAAGGIRACATASLARIREAVVGAGAAVADRGAGLVNGAPEPEERTRSRHGAVLQALLADPELLRAVGAPTGQLSGTLFICQRLAQELLRQVGCTARSVRRPLRLPRWDRDACTVALGDCDQPPAVCRHMHRCERHSCAMVGKTGTLSAAPGRPPREDGCGASRGCRIRRPSATLDLNACMLGFGCVPWLHGPGVEGLRHDDRVKVAPAQVQTFLFWLCLWLPSSCGAACCSVLGAGQDGRLKAPVVRVAPPPP